MMKMKKLFTVALMLGVGSMAFANGLSLNSIGTRAMGMGGAFVGYANDGSALYWNPAGLAGQPTNLMFSGSAIMPSGTYKYDTAGIDATMESNVYTPPNLFFTYNMGDLTLAFGIYTPAGLGAEWNGSELLPFTGGVGPYEWMSELAAIDISPGVAYQVNEKFSVGLAVNIYYAMFEMKRADSAEPIPTVIIPVQYHEESTGMGYGVTIGLKYDVSEQFSLGATFRTSTNVAMSGDASDKNIYPADVPVPYDTESSFDRDVTWPMWIAGGIAYKPNEKLVITADAQYSAWSELDVLKAEYKDWGYTGEFKMDWIDAIQIRVGGEYMASEAFALRLGYYYDPAPAPDETLNFLFPSMTNHVVTGGLSYLTGSWTIDVAAEYLMGAERTVDPTPDNMPGVHQMDIFAFGLGVGYAF